MRQQAYNQSALIANITPSQPHGGMAFERFTDEGPMALLPLPDNRCALVWTRLGMDAQRLAALDAQSLHGLHRSGWLEGAYLVSASLHNMRRLIAENSGPGYSARSRSRE